MPRVLLSELQDRAKIRPEGYLEDVLSYGKVVGDYVEYTQENYKLLAAKYRPQSVTSAQAKEILELSLPTYKEMAVNFVGAFSKWISAGFPVVSQETYTSRMAVCNDCPHWDAAARAGLGKCNQPSCGCTKVKFWLATEKCPIGKWTTVSTQEHQS